MVDGTLMLERAAVEELRESVGWGILANRLRQLITERRDWLETAQSDVLTVDVSRAQGRIAAYRAVLDLPEDILREITQELEKGEV